MIWILLWYIVIVSESGSTITSNIYILLRLITLLLLEQNVF